ncbi:Inorganic pyrophosphatase OS=Tsukamurella paurometabola (strain ATCC 8368 / DSM / CCUG 35730/ CIP 100753 / JCM 10117 / KCTC 9821 / NBRC 16120 / NCIMB 702349/ NCTC 13040) OX=521096 GN=Tpau_2850 PE=4 SV=1 [Tsukamurella paurometabola]|uniref:Inorganic pyrophosphatase n=1 Tax=Tsukamurella paurometabola (strain ATCC 8368 / DSM 20162 / CCUG 35730 / CIP 100753 / JCM 10117 / KCTC 9821 / NBRC 16120 / NCIMB 702349 / NCTC 13040) TaxID=521096 RepID=D5UTG3_TSUPD|nr:inorganic pyrophosphatase [Tsukamurella paurometabola]ADG79448.1 conserved hypothetical protein [Tsukamurella paurometabola DSM 20162]SUP35788.1 Uncharacterised protein [Tsukamurella paurometabola]
MLEPDFFDALDRLLATSELIVDRRHGTAHPRYPGIVYPVDYGYLAGTVSGDGQGIDVFRGSDRGRGVVGAFVTVDRGKRDTEVKLLVDCTIAEIVAVDALLGRLHLPRARLVR